MDDLKITSAVPNDLHIDRINIPNLSVFKETYVQYMWEYLGFLKCISKRETQI